MTKHVRGPSDIYLVEQAIKKLRAARIDLAAAGAGRSAAKVRRAIKSSEGALRHVQGIVSRFERRDRAALQADRIAREGRS